MSRALTPYARRLRDRRRRLAKRWHIHDWWAKELDTCRCGAVLPDPPF